jgi:pimeloyl-ACP methyl ester carboxylesterase
MTVGFVELDWGGRRVRIEHEWLGRERVGRPLLVFLHEGLGSRSMWRDFPRELCDAAGCRGLVYSRPGYGQSTPRAHDERWSVDYMHRQAHEVLPALLEALRIDAAPWLVGHSDGGSIALIHAGSGVAPRPLGVITMAAHVFVETVSTISIAKARVAYEESDLRQKLARFHDDVDGAFYSWNCTWMLPAFIRGFNIEDDVTRISCPLTAIQGEDDEYGTVKQLDSIRAKSGGRAEIVLIPNCRHSPHRDQKEATLGALQRHVARALAEAAA